MCRPGGRRCPSSKSKTHGGGRLSRSQEAVAIRALTPEVADILNAAYQSRIRRNNGGRAQLRDRTTDKNYIAKHGTDMYDPMRTPFDELPEDAKAEMISSASDITRYLSNNTADLEKIGTEGSRARARAAQHIHEAWLKHNKWTEPHNEYQPKLSKSSEVAQADTLERLDAVIDRLQPTYEIHHSLASSGDTRRGAVQSLKASAAADGYVGDGDIVLTATNVRSRQRKDDGSVVPMRTKSADLIVLRKPLVPTPDKPKTRKFDGLYDETVELMNAALKESDPIKKSSLLYRVQTRSNALMKNAGSEDNERLVANLRRAVIDTVTHTPPKPLKGYLEGRTRLNPSAVAEGVGAVREDISKLAAAPKNGTKLKSRIIKSIKDLDELVVTTADLERIKELRAELKSAVGSD